MNVLSGALTAKRLEVLRELVPQVSLVACLMNPSSPEAQTQLADMQMAARTFGQEILVLNASHERDFDTVFATLVQQRAGALLVANDAVFVLHREHLVTLSARHAIPVMYFLREFAAAGGLMSNGNSKGRAVRHSHVIISEVAKGPFYCQPASALAMHVP